MKQIYLIQEFDAFNKTKEENTKYEKKDNLKEINGNGSEKKSSLFGEINSSKKGLFGKLSNDEEIQKEKPKLFSDKGDNNLFGKSLFSDKPLFSFSSESQLFKFDSLKPNEGFLFSKQENKKSDDEEDEGEDDELQGSNSPNAYNPENLNTKSTSKFTKMYVSHVENILVYNKEDNKFVSKGSGYLSIEYTDVDQKVAFIVFR